MNTNVTLRERTLSTAMSGTGADDDIVDDDDDDDDDGGESVVPSAHSLQKRPQSSKSGRCSSPTKSESGKSGRSSLTKSERGGRRGMTRPSTAGPLGQNKGVGGGSTKGECYRSTHKLF
jgi:hypothetical protein